MNSRIISQQNMPSSEGPAAMYWLERAPEIIEKTHKKSVINVDRNMSPQSQRRDGIQKMDQTLSALPHEIPQQFPLPWSVGSALMQC